MIRSRRRHAVVADRSVEELVGDELRAQRTAGQEDDRRELAGAGFEVRRQEPRVRYSGGAVQLPSGLTIGGLISIASRPSTISSAVQLRKFTA